MIIVSYHNSQSGYENRIMLSTHKASARGLHNAIVKSVHELDYRREYCGNRVGHAITIEMNGRAVSVNKLLSTELHLAPTKEIYHGDNKLDMNLAKSLFENWSTPHLAFLESDYVS